MHRVAPVLALLVLASGCELLIDASRHVGARDGGRPRVDSGRRDAGGRDASVDGGWDAGSSCSRDAECGPTGLAVCQAGRCRSLPVSCPPWRETDVSSLGGGELVAPPLLLGVRAVPGLEVLAGFSVLGSRGPSTAFGVGPVVSAGSGRMLTFRSLTEMEFGWDGGPTGPDPAGGIALATTAGAAAHLAMAEGSDVGLSLGVLDGGSASLRHHEVSPRHQLAGPLAIALYGEEAVAVWKEFDASGYRLADSTAPGHVAAGVSVDGHEAMVSTGGPYVVAPLGEGRVAYFSPRDEIAGELETPGRPARERVGAAWRGSRYELLLAWPGTSSLVHAIYDCMSDGCTLSRSTEVPLSFPVERPAMVALPTGSLVIVRARRGARDELLLFAFDDDGDLYPLEDSEVADGALVVDSWATGAVVDLAMVTVASATTRHVLIGMLPDPEVLMAAGPSVCLLEAATP